MFKKGSLLLTTDMGATKINQFLSEIGCDYIPAKCTLLCPLEQ